MLMLLLNDFNKNIHCNSEVKVKSTWLPYNHRRARHLFLYILLLWAATSPTSTQANPIFLRPFISLSAKDKRKAWSPQEKVQIIKLLERADKLAPGLQQAAAYKDQIELIRVVSISSDHKRDLVLADSANGQITIPDSFFSQAEGEQLETIIHELVHLSDSACLVAFSPDWISQQQTYTEDVRSLQRPFSLIESLADSVSASLVNKKCSDKKMLNEQIFRIIHPDARTKEFLDQFRLGERLYFAHKYGRALSQFKELAEYKISSPMVQVYITQSAMGKGDFQVSLIAAGSAVHGFSLLNLTPAESPFHDVLVINAFLLMEIKKFESALKIADDLLLFNPMDERALALKSRCEEALQP